VGTSLQVYPAANLMKYAPWHIPFYYVDPNPQVNVILAAMPNVRVIAEKASTGIPKFVQEAVKATDF
jgi:NAD-dependent deacetylase